ncbi:MAG: hypothetical protein ACK5NF_08080 [Bacilli bacterium]
MFEPNVETYENKLNVLKKLRSKKISNYLFISPILPYITDWKAIVDDCYAYTDEMLFENLNVRGNNKKAVIEVYEQHYPNELVKLRSLLNDKQLYKKYIENLESEINEYCEIKKINHRIFFIH